MPETNSPKKDDPGLGEIITNIARKIAAKDFSTGDRAALRRLEDKVPNAPIFWSLMARCNANALDRDAEEIRRWALILRGMAIMAPYHHPNTNNPGAMLAKNDFSELRLAKFLSARGAQFRDQYLLICRFLAVKGEAIDWRVLAKLVLAEGRNEKWAEEQRMAIARAYFRTKNSKEKAA